jgi:nicotinate-nucleotide adenylyltransferase
MKIAIFGGSFDPIHVAHERIAKHVVNNFDIDKLIIVPTFLNPFKESSRLDASLRLELVKEVFKDEKKIEICVYEVQKKEKISTYETLQYLKSIYPLQKVYLVIGADNLKNIDLWYNAQQLREEVEFVVISRDGIVLENDFIDANYIQLNIDISSTQLKKNMELEYIPTNIQEKVIQLWKKE